MTATPEINPHAEPTASAAQPEAPIDSLSAQIPLDALEDPRVAVLQAEVDAAKDQMLRALAEIENVRRRSERAAEDARLFAIDRFGKDLLQVADMMARAMTSVPESQDDGVKTFVDGVRLTERALLDSFARNGLKRIGQKGEKFDPNQHQAVSQIPADVPNGHIVEVLQAGFTLNDRTLRAAMVIVSAGPAAGAPPPGSEGIDIKV
jgi:molecular chaperone GrpE